MKHAPYIPVEAISQECSRGQIGAGHLRRFRYSGLAAITRAQSKKKPRKTVRHNSSRLARYKEKGNS